MPRPDGLFIPRKQYPELPSKPEPDKLDRWAGETTEFLKKLVDNQRTNDLAVQNWANTEPGAAQTHAAATQAIPDTTWTSLTGLTTDYDTNASFAAPIVQSDTFVLPAVGRWFLYMDGYIQDEGPDFPTGLAQIRFLITNPSATTVTEHDHYCDFTKSGSEIMFISLGYNLNCTTIGQTVAAQARQNFNNGGTADTFVFKLAEFSCFQLSLPPTSVQ